MEGPSLVILKEEAQPFVGKRIVAAGGSSKIDKDRIINQTIQKLQTWGKHFLIVLDDCTIRIHYLMFGNYYINSKHPEKIPKLLMEFTNGEWNNYNCAVRIIEETDLGKIYDWSTDVMSDQWNAAIVRKKLKARPEALVCDALLDQNIFTGVGNIIKNDASKSILSRPLAHYPPVNLPN